MDATAQSWLLAVGRTTLCSVLAAAIAWALLNKLRIASPRVHRLAWALVIAQGWLLFAWTFQVEVAGERPHRANAILSQETVIAGEPVMEEDYGAAAVAVPTKDAPGTPWHLWILVIWAVGAVAVAGRYIRNYAAVLNQLPLGSPPGEKPWLVEWERARRHFNIRRKAEFRLTRNLGPLLCYVPFFYLVLAPRSLWSRLNPNQREAVLKHELAHLARGDLWKSAAIRLLALPQWFNPFIWWAVRRFDEAGEWACDDLASRTSGEDESTYANALLRVAEFSTKPLSGAVAAQGGVLSRRIERLFTSPFKEERVMKKMIVPGLLLALAVAQVVRFEAVAGEEESSLTATAPMSVDPGAAKQAAAPVSPDRTAELYHAGLLPYRVSPPDVLRIRLAPAQAKEALKLYPGDIVEIRATGANPGQKLVRRRTVGSDGQIEFDESMDSISVGGLTPEECFEGIARLLTDHGFSSPKVTVSIMGPVGLEGEHLVRPDGTVHLGRFGDVYVAGMTVDKIRGAVEKKLSGVLDEPKVYVDVADYNSAVVYVCLKGLGGGDNLFRIPCKPGMRVLDLIASTEFRQPVDLNGAKIWVSRPSGNGGGSEQILPVDWKAISESDDTATNYPLMPGDRVFITPQGKVARRPTPVGTPTLTYASPASAYGGYYGRPREVAQAPTYPTPKYQAPKLKRSGLAPYRIDPANGIANPVPAPVPYAGPAEKNRKEKPTLVVDCRIINPSHDGRRSIVRTPRLTLVDSQETTIVDKSESPFVIATQKIVGTLNVAHQPVIEVLTEGLAATIKVSRIDDEWLRLDATVEESWIEGRNNKIVAGTMTLQAPVGASATRRFIKTIRLGEVVEIKLGQGRTKSKNREFHLVVTKDGYDDPAWQATPQDLPDLVPVPPTY